jgi:uncharacterized membrane protein
MSKWLEKRWYILLWLPLFVVSSLCALFSTIIAIGGVAFYFDPPNVAQGLSPAYFGLWCLPFALPFVVVWVVVLFFYPKYEPK